MNYLRFTCYQLLKRIPQLLMLLTRYNTQVTVFLLLCIINNATLGQSNKKHSANALQAAYLYNFINFTHWPTPSSVTHPFTLCVDDPIGVTQEIANLANKKVGNQSISIVRVTPSTTLSDCHILFFNNTKRRTQKALLNRFKDAPILTVGTSKSFIQEGGMIQLKTNHGRVTFSVNLGPSKQSGLTISANMLDVAQEVLP